MEITSKKIINVLIDNIDPEIGIRGNIIKSDDTFYTIEDMFSEATINYYASGTLMCKNKLIDNWIYPIIVHNLTFINFMFDWGDTNKDIIALLPTRVKRLYFEGRGTIVVIIKEPLQAIDPQQQDLQNFIRMIEENPRYKNIIFLTLHDIDSPNFIWANVIEDTMKDWGPSDNDYKTKEETYEYLENYKGRRFLCLLANYKESFERRALIKFLEQHKLLNEGFVSAPGYPSAEIFKELDITSSINKSLINIIPEGNFDRKGYHFISEKTYRSFVYRKPFIYLGQYKSIEYMQSLGYKTFSPIIDEGYDNIKDDKRRAAQVFTEIKRLIDKPLNDFVKDMKQLKNICEHNYNLYLHNKHESKNKFYKKIYGTYNEPYTDPKFQH
jgi:hypothetical protein